MSENIPTAAEHADMIKTIKKDALRTKIELNVGDDKSLLGTVSDAASYAIDDIAMSILALDNSDSSSYKTAKIELFEQLHGDNSWQTAVNNAQRWFDARKNGTIKLPPDIKGIEAVFQEVAVRSTGVSAEIEKYQAQL